MSNKKWNFSEVGENVTIYEPVVIIKPEAIVLKSNIRISEFAYIAGGLGLCVGSFIHIAAHTCISGGGYCILEDFVGLSAGVRLITGSEDISGIGLPTPTVPQEFRSYYRSFVHCKKHSFLATNVIVHPGVTIGEGAVVGSGSVVTKDLDSWGIYMGSPAQRVKDRPRERILELEQKVLDSFSIDNSDFSEVLAKINEFAE
jgi:galactoside O-acetyltransferase